MLLLMLLPTCTRRWNGYPVPMSRTMDGPVPTYPVCRCQRCGDVRPEPLTFCSECHRVLGFLVLGLGLTFGQIAQSGEYDPPPDPFGLFPVPVRVSLRKRHEERVAEAMDN